jgi:hypothetical protein
MLPEENLQANKMTQVCVHEPSKYEMREHDKIPNFSLEPRFVQGENRLTRIDDPDAISPFIWNVDFGKVTWQLETDSSDFENRKDQIKLFKRVFFQASLETDLVINQKRRGSADADIRITFQGAKDNKYFKDRRSVLAYAYGASTGIGGDITFNDDHIWTLDGKPITAMSAWEKGLIEGFDNPENLIRTYDAQHTGTHEGGHALSMAHTPDCKHCVMFPYYNKQRKFQSNDLAILHRFYGKAGVSSRIKAHLYNRFGIV